MSKEMSRRDFLKLGGVTLAALALRSCIVPGQQPTIESTQPVPSPEPSLVPEPTVDATAEAISNTQLNSNLTDVNINGAVFSEGIGGEISGVFGDPKITEPLTADQITATRAMLGQINPGTLYAVEGGKAVIQRLTGIQNGIDYSKLPDNQVPFRVTVTMLPNTFLQKDGEYDILQNETKPGEARYIRTNDQTEWSVTSTFLVSPGFLPTNACFWWDMASMGMQPVIWDGNGNPRLMGDLQVKVEPALAPTATAAPTKTQTATATPEATLINEKELDPNYIETVSQKYMGVQIDADLITDKSVSSDIKKITESPNVYAEFIARSIFNVWWVKSGTSPRGPSNEKDFTDFMALWAKAQENNDPADWQKLQIPNIWANDLNDGNGYKQKPYTMLFMFNGDAPEGVRKIDTFSIVFFGNNVVKNVTVLNNLANQSFGTNLDESSLYIYMASDVVTKFSKDFRPLIESVYGTVADAPAWLLKNHGQEINGFLPNSLSIPLAKLLQKGFQLYQ